MSGDVGNLAQTGRLAGLFCRLANERFTGVVYAERVGNGGVFSFRDGQVVFVEEPDDEQSLADLLLEKGLITSAQYAEIATRVIESLAENEDVAFCELAVEHGALSREQLDEELARIVRGRVIQAIDWEGCRIEVDTDPDSVAGILECPQRVYPLVYMGVRTFFDEERVNTVLGRSGALFVRLTRGDRELVAQFGLDDHEGGLLARLRPDAPIAQVIEQSGVDAFEAWQLVCTLLLAGAAEIGGTAFSPAERSGVRTTNAIVPPSSKYGTPSDMREERIRPPSEQRMPAAREGVVRPPSERRIPAAREEVVRPGSERRMPVAREEVARPGSERRMPAAREDVARGAPERRTPGVREEIVRQPSERRMPAARGEVARPASERRMPAAHEPQVEPQRAARPAQGAQPAQRASGRSTSGMQAAREEQVARDGQRSVQPATPPARPHSPEPDTVSVGNPRETADTPPLRDRRKPRKLSSALKRLDRELKQLRPQQTSTPVEQSAAALATGAAGSNSQASYARARVDQLMRMRAATLNQQAQAAKPAPAAANGQDSFHAAKKELREQQFARAHELMRKACEAEPENQIYSIYCMYAALRANALKQEDINKLRLMLRDKISDDVHKGFAYYALGHVALIEKKDEAAERFFQKAVELDKNNKDAERYLRIIGVKRKTAEQEKASKIFGIEIGLKKS